MPVAWAVGTGRDPQKCDKLCPKGSSSSRSMELGLRHHPYIIWPLGPNFILTSSWTLRVWKFASPISCCSLCDLESRDKHSIKGSTPRSRYATIAYSGFVKPINRTYFGLSGAPGNMQCIYRCKDSSISATSWLSCFLYPTSSLGYWARAPLNKAT